MDRSGALIDQYFQTGTLEALPNRHFIDAEWRPSVEGRTMETYDAGLARPFHRFAAGTGDDVAIAVGAAQRTQKAWGRTPPADRGTILARAAALLRAEVPRFSVIESLDSGKPLREAAGDVAGAARAFDYYAGTADKLQGDTFPLGANYLGYSIHEPIGVTAHIIPWNYPISTAARGIAPALAAGCTVVAKPAETTPLTMLMLAELLHRAGLPVGVCNVVTGTGAATGAPLVAHPDVAHLTFTGSVPTGIDVMRTAAANVTSVVLELGGKSPLIVLRDADLKSAADGVIGAIYENAGQVCSAGSRLIVEQQIHAELLERVVNKAGALTIGHGLRDRAMGPVNSKAQLDKIVGIVDAARARGLQIVTGGSTTMDPDSGRGWFFEPTIIDDVPETDTVVQDEIFGPVLAVQIADDPAHALELANGTQYALVAGIYTKDFDTAHWFARDLDAGQVYINEYFAGGIEVPFGGNRHSGFGREKGLAGLRNYTRLKSVAARIVTDG